MKQKLIAFGIVGAFAISTANADNHGKGVVGDKGVAEEAVAVDDSIGATLSVGYDSHYIWRGVDNGRNAVSAGLDYSFDLLPVPIELGAWYVNPTSSSRSPLVNPEGGDELQLSAAVLGPEMAGLSTWLGYTGYIFPENEGRNAGDSNSEIGAGIGTTVGPIDLSASAYFDFYVDGWYFDLTAGHTLELSDMISLVLAAGISYEVDFWGALNGGADGWNNVLLSAGLPIALTDRATLQPYIAATFALEAIDGFQSDQLFGGVSLSVDF